MTTTKGLLTEPVDWDQVAYRRIKLAKMRSRGLGLEALRWELSGALLAQVREKKMYSPEFHERIDKSAAIIYSEIKTITIPISSLCRALIIKGDKEIKGSFDG